jgi:hypothetical protein
LINNEHIYIFPQAVDEFGSLKLNIYEDKYALTLNEGTVFIGIDEIKKNTSNLVLYDRENDTFIFLDDYIPILEKYAATNEEFLKKINKNAFMQIDYYGSSHFVKVFLPALQMNLNSDTHDFSKYGHFPIGAIHPIDWRYQPTAILHSAELDGPNVKINIESIPSVLDDVIYYQYNGSAGTIPLGFNDITLPYKPGEIMRIGKYEGFDRSYKDIDIDKHL